jgi:RNA polymerase sigma-70 factor (ECF subfamily)
MLGADADGEDVSQIVFIQAFEAIRRKSRIENPRAWLLGIARHRCLDRLKRRRRAPVLADADELECAIDRDAPGEDMVTGDAGASRSLDDCLDKLDARSRMVVLLRFRDQLSYEAISKLTGDRPGALRVRVTRALRSLRRAYLGSAR